MPKEDAESYSNPLPPPDYNAEVGDDAHPLTNEDFRKLLMTPRVAVGSSSGGHGSLSASAASGGDGGRHGVGGHELKLGSAGGHGASSVSDRGLHGSSGASGSSGVGGGSGLSLSDLVGSGGGSGAGTHGGDEGLSVGARMMNLDDDEPDVGDNDDDDDDDPATRRRKKKSYYARLKRMEEDRQRELAQKYRDRAKERRDGLNRDYAETEIISTTADYSAVAPDAKGENYAERRKQIIQESKYLGGDMEHTHLVKGLDYALLEKVRAEITSKEREEEEELELALTQKKEKEDDDPEDQMHFKTKMGRNIYRIIFKSKYPERNELFLPSRMAYVVDLEDEFAESDVPTTLIRSKVDCPAPESDTTLTTNDIVINKLTQILSYLRQGRRENKKLKKKEKHKLKEEERSHMRVSGGSGFGNSAVGSGTAGSGSTGGGSGNSGEKNLLPGHDENIYGDIGEYHPSTSSSSKGKRDRRDRDRSDRDRDRDRDRNVSNSGDRDRDRGRDYYERSDRERGSSDRRDRDRDRGDRADRDRNAGGSSSGFGSSGKKTYFEKPAEEDEEKERMPNSAKELVKSINECFKSYAEIEEEKEKVANKKEEERLRKLKAKMEIDSYAECYPGMMESADAIDDSDDEVDYTKMDHGNKKGPIGRWDFDSQEEYSEYMANKEAMPKAAFQYGVKMADGRKTRRTGPKDEKAELDRQWQKIQKIIEKRKNTDDNFDYNKRVKY